MSASAGELRQRLPQEPAVPQQAQDSSDAKQIVMDLNAAEDKSASKEKKTFGRTPNGTGE